MGGGEKKKAQGTLSVRGGLEHENGKKRNGGGRGKIGKRPDSKALGENKNRREPSFVKNRSQEKQTRMALETCEYDNSVGASKENKKCHERHGAAGLRIRNTTTSSAVKL